MKQRGPLVWLELPTDRLRLYMTEDCINAVYNESNQITTKANTVSRLGSKGSNLYIRRWRSYRGNKTVGMTLCARYVIVCRVTDRVSPLLTSCNNILFARCILCQIGVRKWRDNCKLCGKRDGANLSTWI